VRIESLRKNYDVAVELVHFPLHPETPAEGITLDALFGGRADDPQRKARQERMKALMRAEGLPYGERSHTYNSRLAQELGKWADTDENRERGGEAIHDRLYKAYFVEGRNIGDPEVLVGIAAAAGLPADEARKVLEERSFKDAVDRDWALSRQVGVTGVPTFAAGGYGVVGAQPYEALEKLVLQAGGRKRSGTAVP
jgi:predicted DsbA family dithiol-disulfide isomerase